MRHDVAVSNHQLNCSTSVMIFLSRPIPDLSFSFFPFVLDSIFIRENYTSSLSFFFLFYIKMKR